MREVKTSSKKGGLTFRSTENVQIFREARVTFPCYQYTWLSHLQGTNLSFPKAAKFSNMRAMLWQRSSRVIQRVLPFLSLCDAGKYLLQVKGKLWVKHWHFFCLVYLWAEKEGQHCSCFLSLSLDSKILLNPLKSQSLSVPHQAHKVLTPADALGCFRCLTNPPLCLWLQWTTRMKGERNFHFILFKQVTSWRVPSWHNQQWYLAHSFV